MFDGLFGGKKPDESKILELEEQNKTLKARVDELKSLNKNLSDRLSKQDVRAKKALSDKQDSDEALNKAKSRIETLEYELSEMKKQRSCELTFKKTVTLTNEQSLDLLFRLGSILSRSKNLLSVYLRPGGSIADLDEFERTINIAKDTISLVQKIKSPTGIALFYDMERLGISPLIVAPPFMVSESGWKLDTAFDVKPLQEVLDFDFTVGIVFTRAGETFIGVSNRETLIDYKIVRSSVKGKHKKGGWSQKRFERLIEKDVRNHAEKARIVFEELMAAHKADIKRVVGSGEHNLFNEITSGCTCPVLFKSLDVKLEKHNVDRIRTLVWSSKWYELP